MDRSIARRLWSALEPYHAVVYFSPDARELYGAAGLKGGWMGYFASRSAALGRPPAPVVTAAFYSFHPRMVERAIPDAWTFCEPERILDVRLELADRTLRRLLGDKVDAQKTIEVAALLRRAIEGVAVDGRVLYGAHAALEWPDLAHLVLWHGATLVREHRGDGHVAALVAHDIDGCAALVLQAAVGGVDRAMIQPVRGWSDDEWTEAQTHLMDRNLVDAHGVATDAGRALHSAIEEKTDELALAPWKRLGEAETERLYDLVLPLAHAIASVEGGMPYPNPIGVPPPS